MSKFFINAVPVRLTFADNEWCDLKPELSQRDSDYIMSKMVKASGSTEKPELSLELGKLPLMERFIVGWSFAEDGKSIPVTSENISNLQSRYRQPILAKIDELTKQANDFSKNSLRAST